MKEGERGRIRSEERKEETRAFKCARNSCKNIWEGCKERERAYTESLERKIDSFDPQRMLSSFNFIAGNTPRSIRHSAFSLFHSQSKLHPNIYDPFF